MLPKKPAGQAIRLILHFEHVTLWYLNRWPHSMFEIEGSYKYAIMEVFMYASISMQVCNYVGVQVCKYASMLVWNSYFHQNIRKCQKMLFLLTQFLIRCVAPILPTFESLWGPSQIMSRRWDNKTHKGSHSKKENNPKNEENPIWYDPKKEKENQLAYMRSLGRC